MPLFVYSQEELDQLSDNDQDTVVVKFGTVRSPAMIRGKNRYTIAENFVCHVHDEATIEVLENAVVYAYDNVRVEYSGTKHSKVYAYDKTEIIQNSHDGFIEKHVSSQEELDQIPDDCGYRIIIEFGSKKSPAIIKRHNDYNIIGDYYCNVYNEAKVTACHYSCVYAYDNAKVYANWNTTVYAYNHTKVTDGGSAIVYAFDESHVFSFSNAYVDVHDKAVVERYGIARVTAYDEAYVFTRTPIYTSSPNNRRKPIEAHDRVIVDILFGEPCVIAHDQSTILVEDGPVNRDDRAINCTVDEGVQIIRDREKCYEYRKKGRIDE